MEKLRIVGWDSFECEYPSRKCSKEEMDEIISLIRDEIIEHRYYFGGEEHQNCSTGVPVFSDGTCFRASMRCWGYLMSTIYVGPNDEELSYMDFYMSLGENAILPEKKEIKTTPAILEDEFLGLMVSEDGELLSQTIGMGMPLMTFDKVLKRYMEKLEEENA